MRVMRLPCVGTLDSGGVGIVRVTWIPYILFPAVLDQFLIYCRAGQWAKGEKNARSRWRSLSTLSLPTYIVAGGSTTVEVK
jgi:hypothetical protein